MPHSLFVLKYLRIDIAIDMHFLFTIQRNRTPSDIAKHERWLSEFNAAVQQGMKMKNIRMHILLFFFFFSLKLCFRYFLSVAK